MEEENEGIDRLTTLPNSLLCHILSFLPTKTSVDMSLVSRKCRHLWKTLDVFNFHDNCDEYTYQGPDDEYNEQFMLFTVFVNTVLSLRRSRVIRKFRLSCDHIYPDPFAGHSIDTWISTAIGPHLEEFHLTIFSADGFSNLPLTLFSCCSNLVSLSLNGYILLQLQESSVFCLPSLKVLQLLEYRLDLNSVNILLSRCSVLENLEISFNPESLAIIRVPSSLKRLKITVENDVGALLEIDAPGLKYLSLKHITFCDATAVGNFHNVEEAYLDVSHSAMPLLLGDFPEFRYLLHLQLGLLSFNSTFLFDMLQKCPLLQSFTTYLFKKVNRSYDSSPSYKWEAKPKSVPKYLVSHLTFIRFQGYIGNEMEFIGYVLQNGLVLKTMIIYEYWLKSLDQPKTKEWLKKISDLPRGSAMCQVKFW
ncbi:putative F-box domain, FBD domain, leucine-rich repeat domain, L domain-containing protein [Medicago truncatula]|uniref:F-box/RNI/FBD-like domain protein n=1 Tax=Medicago truncatula TaxID=3880 RepID=A0A072TQM9_MEDTR|nr:F-box/LRR-repeat protein At3g26922 [Medicago truncatula]KEH19804.1 F-box/RNI/FBD-like domain protein [Medicago truncatula]RHN41101.1 putative F-box domain, FBD domain, leucine-rich repeat domain, L domain-containing protein [Medicago truncatula]